METVSPHLSNPPKLKTHYVPFLRMFYDLNGGRSVSMEGVGGILFSEIICWLKTFCIDRSDYDLYIDMIARLDIIYLKHVKNKNKASSGRSP